MSKLTLCTFIFVATQLAGVARAESPEDIVRKMAQVRKDSKVITCELALEVQTHSKWNRTLKKNELIPTTTYSQIRTGTIDFTQGIYRWDISGEKYQIASRRIEPYRAANSFDGVVLRSVVYPEAGTSNAKPGSAIAADYAEFTGDLQSHGLPMEIRPLFMSHGILPAANQRPLYPGQFHKYDIAANMDTFKSAASVTEPNIGIWLETIMQPSKANDNKASYCFDSRKDFALIRWNEIIRGKVSTSTSLQYVQKGGRYVLSGWVYKTQEEDVPIQTFKVKVIKIEYSTDFDSALTALSAEPGMIAGKMKYEEPSVESPKIPELERFVVKEDGSFEELNSKRSKWQANRNWILLSSSCLTVLVIGLLSWRRFGRRQTLPTETVK